MISARSSEFIQWCTAPRILYLAFISVLFVRKATSTDVCEPDSYNRTATGTDLFCYDCAEIYSKTYDPYDSPCKNNITQIAMRQCGPRDRYCKVEKRSLHGQILNLERGCVETCYYGCRFNGFGLTYKKCTSCCRVPGCNDGNGASSTQYGIQVMILQLSTIILSGMQIIN